VLLTRIGFLGVPTLARLEERGRLAYIDGCSDTLLVSPPRFGDPVLNHLHFPPGTRQGMHRHPSVRLGVVARGKGMAVMAAGEVGLERGKVFLIEAHEAHAFRTEAENLDVVAFHPDSDWGPTDEVHPMRNRTRLIEG
jgi:quercetin dioxygenase-like cupin family protein